LFRVIQTQYTLARAQQSFKSLVHIHEKGGESVGRAFFWHFCGRKKARISVQPVAMHISHTLDWFNYMSQSLEKISVVEKVVVMQAFKNSLKNKKYGF